MLRSMVTSILCWVFREAEKLRCGVVTKDQWRLPRRNCWDSSGLDNGNPMSRSAAGHNSHTTGCNELILEVLKCRRGDLNPHGTRSRQILSLLRMPISPLRPTAQLLERNTFGMNQSTGPDSSSFPALNSRSLCQWVLFWVLTASNCFQFQVAAPLCSCCLAQDAHSIFPSK